MSKLLIVIVILKDYTLKPALTGLKKRVIIQRVHGIQFTLDLECSHGLAEIEPTMILTLLSIHAKTYCLFVAMKEISSLMPTRLRYLIEVLLSYFIFHKVKTLTNNLEGSILLPLIYGIMICFGPTKFKAPLSSVH